MTTQQIKRELESYEEHGQMCRLCMSDECLEDVFKDDQLTEWIWELLAIKIYGDDRMSQVICTICRIRLTEFHQFRKGCHEVQEVLQALIPDPVQTDPIATDQLQHKGIVDDYLIRCEVCLLVFNDEKQLTHHKTIHDHEMQKDTHLKPELVENNELKVQTYDQSISFAKAGSASHLQDEEMENNLLDIEDCLVVEEVKIETRADDEVTVNMGKRKTVSANNLEETDVDKSSNGVPLPRKKHKPSRSRNGNDSTDSEASDSDHADEAEQHTTSDKVYKCSECDRTFNRECRLKSHMTIHEENESESSHESSGEEETIYKSDNLVTSDESEHNSIENEEMYHCDICQNVYSNIMQLKKHKNYHKRKLRQQENPEEKDSKDHLEVSDSSSNLKKKDCKDQIHQCDGCSKTFLTEKILLTHKKNVHGPKRHRCDICDVQYTLRTGMTRHLTTQKHMNNVLEMRKREKEKSSNLNEKLLAKYQPYRSNKKDCGKLFKCNECDKTFSSSYGLSSHKQYHKPKKIFCHVCERPCHNKSMLKRHLATHASPAERHQANPVRDIKNAPRPFKCDICQKAYTDKHALYSHNRTVHGPKKCQCEICGYKCPSNSVLMKHLKKHTLNGHAKEDFQALKKLSQQNDETTNQNDDDELSDQSSVPSDNDTNENDKAHKDPSKSDENSSELPAGQPFQCDVCHEAFESTVHLDCHKRFVCRQQKNMHMKIHKSESTDTKDFECPECHKIYPSWKSLYFHVKNGHVRRKTLPKERTVACPKCDKMFQTARQRDLHMRRVHTAAEHKCDICNKEFSERIQLWQHMYNQHGEKLASSDSEDTTDESDLEDSVQISDEESAKPLEGNVKVKEEI